jgi:hypothetical protein
VNLKDSEVKNLAYGVGEVKNISFHKGEPLALEVDEFLNSIIEKRQPINSGLIGKQVVEILELASKSIKDKQ